MYFFLDGSLGLLCLVESFKLSVAAVNRIYRGIKGLLSGCAAATARIEKAEAGAEAEAEAEAKTLAETFAIHSCSASQQVCSGAVSATRSDVGDARGRLSLLLPTSPAG